MRVRASIVIHAAVAAAIAGAGGVVAAADAPSALPPSRVTIAVEGAYRIITSNGIPDHQPGAFPNRGNPNAIAAQEHTFRVPVAPKVNADPTPMRGMFGVALNGVPFDPGTAEWWTPAGRGHDPASGWNYDALSGKIDLGIDAHHAHVQPTGAYHYHGVPTGLGEAHDHDHNHDDDHDHEHAHAPDAMTMIGYAADGFPIYALVGYKEANDATSVVVEMRSSYRLKQGARPADGPPGAYDGTFVQDWEFIEGSGDLDACNGRTGVTPEYPQGTYYYVATDAFPFIPRFYRGTPDASFAHRGPPPGGRGGPGAGGPPRGGRGQQGDRPARIGRRPADGQAPPPPPQDPGAPTASRDAAHGTPDARPNIVLMVVDDQSWDGLSVAMHPQIASSRSTVVRTPNIERLAHEGMRFSAAYAPAPVCSPTRVSIMTGKSPAAVGWTRAGPSATAADNPKLLPPQNPRDIADAEVTIAEVLRDAGYATAHLGKWHLGGGGPERHGFDVSDGDLGNEAAAGFTDPNPVDIFGMAERAEEFMVGTQERDQPFFLQLSWHALHAPQNALASTRAHYESIPGLRDRQVDRAALAEDLDTGVGRVLAAIDRLGLRENTYVIYMSDNGGGAGGRGPLTGGKGTLGEGGIRVPFIIRGPGIAPDSWCDERIVGFDLYPTVMEWAGIEAASTTLEGGSIGRVAKGEAREIQRPTKELVFHFPHYQGAGGPQSAIYLGKFKLIHFYETGASVLYDIDADPGERTDLAHAMRDRVRALERMLAGRLVDLGAEMAMPNSSYDPAKPRTAGTEDGASPKRRGQGRSHRGNSSPRINDRP